MAWMQLENFVDGKLDNRTPGRVTAWMRFYPKGRPVRVAFKLAGDFRGDLRGKTIRFIGTLQ